MAIFRRYAGKRLGVSVTGGGTPVRGIAVMPFGGGGKVKLPRTG